MDIPVHLSFGPPLPQAVEAAGLTQRTPDRFRNDQDAEQAVSPIRDRYIPSVPAEQEGLYTLEGLLQKVREARNEMPDADPTRTVRPLDPGLAAESARDPGQLDEGDKELIQRLEQRDREVRLHEQTHAAIAGKYAKGPPTYTYQMGPDGKMYAIGGSLAVDTGKEADPQENLEKARILQAASLGVAEPSAADSVVAMQAADLAVAGMEWRE